MSLEKLRFFSDTEKPYISVTSLLGDNHSGWADEARRIWHETKAAGNQTLVQDCGDSRNILPRPDTVAEIKCIATGKPDLEPQKKILQNPGIARVVVMGHFDGETAKIKKMPKGCGGLAAKEEDQLESLELVSNLDYYIRENISHPDPIVQALITAKSMFACTDKPILAAAQDHRTGKIYPIGMYATYTDERRGPKYDEAGLYARKSVILCMDEKTYDPEKFYETGIPALEDYKFPQFRQYLEDGRENEERLKDKFPNLFETSKVQDPLLIAYSPSLIPFATLFPELGEEPGRAFGIFAGYEFKTSSSQIEYPIIQSLRNHGQIGRPFASTNTILIDTEDFSESHRLATQLVAESSVVREWVSIVGHKIIISKTTDGIIRDIDPFNPNI